MSDSREMHDRLNAAEELLRQGKHDDATAELVWLWDNIARISPGMDGVRTSFMARTIAELVRAHPPARQRFAEIRERTIGLADADSTTTARLRFDWIVLNEILADEERTLAWFDSVKDDERYNSLLDKVAQRLIPALKSRERLGDIGRLHKDPVASLVQEHRLLQPPPGFAPEIPAGLPSNIRDLVQASLAEGFRDDAALLLASLIAAGRDADAAAVEREALRLDPSEAMRAALGKALGRLD